MAFKITEKCIGCQACSKKCPVMAITGEKMKLHQINPKRCVDCGVCQNVCPKGAILDENGRGKEKIAKSEWVKPVVDRKLCSACGMCVDVCLFEAINITYPRFKGDLKVYAALNQPDNCVGCKQCEIYCPLHAIHMEVRG